MGTVATVRLFARQFSSPITLILLAATAVSAALGEVADATIIAVIVLASALVGFRQEHAAGRAIDDLLAQVQVSARVMRSGAEQRVAIDEVVRRVQHAQYGKYMTRRRTYAVHDLVGCKVGDHVLIRETRPLSKMKRWRVVEKVTAQGGQS